MERGSGFGIFLVLQLQQPGHSVRHSLAHKQRDQGLSVTSQIDLLCTLCEKTCILKEGRAGEVAVEGEIDVSCEMFTEGIGNLAVTPDSILNIGS